jgi:PAS domain S-box-containing protein
MNEHRNGVVARRRAVTYWVVGLGLTLGYAVTRGSAWQGGVQLHTLMETVATLLAATVGAMALVRFYTKKDNTFLLIAVGFLGTAFLDGYHAVVTSTAFRPYMPSDLPSLIPWSWVASRQFLSIFMFLSWLAWLREDRLGEAGRIREKAVYLFASMFTVASFLFFAFAPLPNAYYPELIFHRPEEFAPALFFFLALIGYLRKGHWRSDAFEHWLVLSLIIGLVGQAVFMSFSGGLFDYEFDAAHTLKKVTYLCVLTGLLTNMYAIFRREELAAIEVVAGERRTRATVENIIDGIITIDEHGIIQSVNPAVQRIFGFGPQELIGNNVRMLAPEPVRGAHDSYLANYVDTGEAKIIGIGREVEGLRKNGSMFPMDLSIAEFRAGTERLFVGVVRDITERKEMDRMKTEFVSTVSHELRTPLTSIRGSLGMIASGKLGEMPDQVQRMVDLAQKNTERLINLVNDLLEMERIQSGRMKFEFQPLDLTSLVEKSLEANKPYAEAHKVAFEMRTTTPGVLVRGDGDRLTQVMANLLSNAAKFSPEGGTVAVSLDHSDEGLRVSVSDRGPGIPEAFRDHIFERFTQADSSDTRQKGGTGLGLSISKAIVEKHGGRIDFHTVTGEGATFFFDMPELKKESATGEDAATSAKRVAVGRGRVLVLEDEPDIAKVMAMMIEQEGYTVDIAHNADMARRRLAENAYQAMTVDILLPEENGVAMINALRQDEKTKDLPIIVVSVKASEAQGEIEGSALGVLDWLDKPIDRDRLRAALRATLPRHRDGGPRILYVEDDSDLVQVITSMVGETADVAGAASLAEAREALARERFDLVLLDVNLPDGSGLDLLPMLKSNGQATTPVVIFSSDALDGDIAGQVDAALVKSRTDNRELVNTIASLIDPEPDDSQSQGKNS